MPPPVCKFFREGNGYNNGYNNGSSSRQTREQTFLLESQIPKFTREIQTDLEEYRDTSTGTLIFSSYSLPHPCKINLIPGRDISFEELRWKYMEAVAQNRVQDYDNEIYARQKDREETLNKVINNARIAVIYLQKSVRDNGTDRTFVQPINFNVTKPVSGINGNNAHGNFSSPFGNSNSSTNSGSGGGIFGAFDKQANPFGGSATSGGVSSPFGSSGTGGGAFGALKPASTGNSIFGQKANATGASLSPAASAGGTSAFGQTGFGAASTTQGAFGKSGFGGNPGAASSSPFGNVGTNTGAASNSPFGNF
ncbi:unnamed protein product [[Candida] boidinii]|nr:unnamed protein product [[Candida] boidinii]